MSARGLPTWWESASPRLAAATTPVEEIRRGVAALDAEACAAALCTRGFMVVDGFLGAHAASAIRAGIWDLDGSGALRLGRVQHGVTQSLNEEARTDRITFIPSVQSSPKQRNAPSVHDAVRALAEDSPLSTYVSAVDTMRERLSAQSRLVDRVDGSLDDCNFMVQASTHEMPSLPHP